MRRKHDAYYTPGWAVDRLLDAINIDHRASILEPCCGGCAISDRLSQRVLSPILTNDIDPACRAMTHYDYLTRPFSSQWTVTNPPFSLAFQFLLKALRESSIGVAMLLRLSFLEPTEVRGEWLAHNPPNLTLVTPRISFTGDGKCDNVTTAWFVWKHGDTDQRTIIIPKTPRRA